MIRDLRRTVRMLLQSKGWTIIVLLSLALGIGVNTTLFSAVNGLLLRSLAVHEPDRMVRLRSVGENEMGRSFSGYGYTGRSPSGKLLACIGLFGLMSFNVARRTNEIGIRMALGAHRQGVVRMVLKESMNLVAIGSVIGLAAAAGRWIESQLYGLAPTDPISIVAAVLAMVVVSAFAGYLPARRASRLNPTIALHHD